MCVYSFLYYEDAKIVVVAGAVDVGEGGNGGTDWGGGASEFSDRY